MTIKQRIVGWALALSAAGAVGIVAHEGLRNTAYVDPVGVVTVCAGHTKTAKLGQVKTDAQCAELLKQDAAEAQAAIRELVKVRLTQDQFDALVSFVFNVGSTNFRKSTLLKRINAGECLASGAEFNKWVYAKGVKLPGLVKRRADERAKWETGCVKSPNRTRAQAHNAYAKDTGILVAQAEHGSVLRFALSPPVADRRYTQRA